MTSDQRTEEWFAARLGFLSASRFREATSFLKNGADSAERAALKIDIASERWTGVKAQSSFVSKDMQRGIDLEPVALEAYKQLKDELVETTGFVKHQSIEWLGCSPDGLVDIDGLVEIKIPRPSNYIAWAVEGEIPPKHMPQLLCQLAVTGRAWVDFVAFCPEMPTNAQLFIRRLWRDEKQIKKTEEQAIKFLSEVDDLDAKIRLMRWW